MCSRRPAHRLSDTWGSAAAADLCPHCRSPSSSDALADYHRLALIISICREGEPAAEGEFFTDNLQVEPQKMNRHKVKWLQMTCALIFLLAFISLLESVGKEDMNVQDYDADVLLPPQALWMLVCLLLWAAWLLLRLVQMLLYLTNFLLWFVSIAASPLCHCASSLLSCLLLLLRYTCDAVSFATSSPLYVYGSLLSVCLSLLIATR